MRAGLRLLRGQRRALPGARTGKSFVTFNPIGVVLAVMPWNFPFWQVFRFAAPGLMAGNTAVLKHASNVPGCALAIEKVFREAGFPDHLFRVLMIGSTQVESVIEHPLVRAVTLTGSGPAGRAVASKAGAMLKKTVLELGGSDPYLILDDADIELTAAVSTKGRLVNSGQSCIAAKRFVVVETARREFEKRFVELMSAVKPGDPLEDTTQLGPLARHDLRDALHRQVMASIAKGARVLLGGAVPNNSGAYYPPTALTDVRKGMPAYGEELFGPVAAIILARDEKEAIATANDTVFGLGSGVITRDLALGERIAEQEIERALSLSTMRSVLIRDCRSEASRKAGTAGNYRPTASRSSSISRPWWWRNREPTCIASRNFLTGLKGR